MAFPTHLTIYLSIYLSISIYLSSTHLALSGHATYPLDCLLSGVGESMCSRCARSVPLVFALLPLLAAQQQPPSLVSLLEVLRQHPDNPGAHNNVGLALKAAGDLQGAVRHFETAIELNPEYARGYNSLGNALQASARTGGGMALMERAAELHLMATQLQPAMASAYNSLGNAQRALDNPEAAVRALSVAVELSGSGTHYSNLGAASLELHRLRVKEAAASGGGAAATAEAAAALEATLRWLRVAEQLSPTDSSAANNLAAALEADGQLGPKP